MSVTLKSNDGQEFKVTEGACALSRFLQNQIQTGKNEIEVEDIKGEILKLVVDYLNYYSNREIPKIPDVLSSNDLKNEVSDWDYRFVGPLNYEQTFHLINAGLLLELDHLHDLACAKIAAFMKGKSPEDVNKEFTIECQLTQEEAKQLGLDAN